MPVTLASKHRLEHSFEERRKPLKDLREERDDSFFSFDSDDEESDISVKDNRLSTMNRSISFEDTTLTHSRNTSTAKITSTVHQSTDLLVRPTYSTYFTPHGTRNSVLSTIHASVEDARDDWRSANLDAEIAKHNSRFAEDPAERRHERAKFAMLHGQREMLRLRKWAMEDDEKEHKEVAKELKKQHGKEIERRKSAARLRKLEKQKASIAGRRRWKKAPAIKAGGGRDSEWGFLGRGIMRIT